MNYKNFRLDLRQFDCLNRRSRIELDLQQTDMNSWIILERASHLLNYSIIDEFF